MEHKILYQNLFFFLSPCASFGMRRSHVFDQKRNTLFPAKHKIADEKEI